MPLRIFLAALFALALPAAVFASAPAAPAVKKPSGEAHKPAKKAGPICLVRGRLYCSEYGTRYKEPVMVVFVDGDDRFGSPVSEKDGAFEAGLPCGASYTMRVEFKGKGADIGTLDVPPKSEGGFKKYIELHHPGSELELVWEIRDSDSGGGVNVGLKLVDPPIQEPAKE
jgi:hypothetical protein